MNMVSGMWPGFPSEWGDPQIKKISLDKDGKQVFLSLFCDFFSLAQIEAFAPFIRTQFPGYRVTVDYNFAEASFCADACRYIIQRLQRGGLPINGYFNDCEIEVDGGRAVFSLGHGGLSVLQSLDFERLFKSEAAKLFGFAPELSFGGVTEIERAAAAAPETAPEKPQKKPGKARNTRRLTEKDRNNTHLALENDEYQLIMGKKPALDVIETLEGVSTAGGRCTVWGDVFFKEIREVRGGSTVYTVSFTDYTGAVSIKVVDRKGELAVLARISKGDTLVVAGDIVWDKYENEYVMSPRDIVKVFPLQKKDTAERKRVELHLHTNMSAMDGIVPVEKAIDRALQYGHKAVAITDHGVLQAYPDAQNYLEKVARKKDPDFKVIYGIECYYVDDSAGAVDGVSAASIDDELICFDLETTGLSAETDRIIEIGAVRIRNGEMVDSFVTFVDPERPIPPQSTEISGITDEMVKGAPREAEAVEKFLAYIGDLPLIAHNAGFDIGFLAAAVRRRGEERRFVSVDTVALSQSLLPQLKRHRLDSLTKHFGLPTFQHHRANDDAAALARIYFKLCDMLRERGAQRLDQINGAVGGRNPLHIRPHHMVLLVQNQKGLKNLYQLVTKSHLDYFSKNPRVPRSELLKHREGLLIGSACQDGEVFTAIREGRAPDAVAAMAEKYDYFEIQPRDNNLFLVEKEKVDSVDAILDINRKIVQLARQQGKPVIAAGDVHYLDARDAVYRQIILQGIGFDEGDAAQSLRFRTTDEMLAEFAYLGEEAAREIVVDNTVALADRIEPDIRPIPEGTFTPSIEGSNETLRRQVQEATTARYGPAPPPEVTERIQKELDSVIGNDYSVLYVVAEKLVSRSEQRGYHVGSRGSVGSSIVANLTGISEVNPLRPHFLCPTCKHFEWIPDTGSGFDVPDKPCPQCGTVMAGDGHDIPFETFLGFEGEKQPDIDLNFSSEYQLEAHQHTREIFGDDHVFKAGTISALKDRTAYGLVKGYLEESGRIVNKAEERRLIAGCTGVKRTTGQHPGGMVVVPQGCDITDFTPAQHPADNSDRGVVTTHFDFTSLHDTLLKLDELGHDVPTMYHYIEELTGMSVNDVPMNDPEVLKLFTSVEPLGVSESDIDSSTGTFGIPEMGTATVRNLLNESQPANFSDLVQVSGLSHGTDVWANNAQELIANGVCTIGDVIGTRDSIMVELIKMGVKPSVAFEVMELTRRGKAAEGFTEEHLAELRKNKVPDWYVKSCLKIKYMFPKAHAAAYVISAIRLAWFKLYRPLEFYATYFTVRGSDIDYEAATGGKSVAKNRMATLKAQMREAARGKDDNKRSQKDEDTYIALQMICEMLFRGYAFLPVDLYRSHATRYAIEDGKLRLPFVALKGVGENAANALYAAGQKGGYVSAEDMMTQPGVTPSLVDTLDKYGALGDLPKSSQLSLF